MNGMKQGHGEYSYANGKKYNGNWEDNKKHGEGIWTFKDGKKQRGIWNLGERT